MCIGGGKTSLFDKMFEVALYFEQVTPGSWVCC